MADFRRDGKLIYRVRSFSDFGFKYGAPAWAKSPQFLEDEFVWTKVSIPTSSSTDIYVYYALPEPPADPFNDGSEVAFYKLDGNANDEHGNYNGTWGGTEQYTSGVFNQAAKFDGGSYISTSPILGSSPDTFTCSILAKGSTGCAVQHGYTGNSSQWSIWVGTEIVRVEIRDNGFPSPTKLYGNLQKGWNHIVFVCSVSQNFSKLFVNGVLVDTNTAQNMSSHNFFIMGVEHSGGGESVGGYEQYYIGSLDNVRIFNRALSDEEVQQLYELEKPYIVSNGEEVFEFFDDFDGNDLDTTYWNKGSGSYTVENSYIKMWGAYDDEGRKHKTKQSYHSPFRIVWRGRCSTSGDIDCRIALYKESDSSNIATIGIDNEGGGSDWHRWVAMRVNGTGYHHSELAGTEWRLCDVKVFDNKIDFIVEGLTPITANYDFNSVGNMIIGILADSDASDRFGYIDYIGIAKLTDPEPTISYGNEETGSWTIDGYTFTKRRKVTITNNSSENLVDYQVKLDLGQFGTQCVRVMKKV